MKQRPIWRKNLAPRHARLLIYRYTRARLLVPRVTDEQRSRDRFGVQHLHKLSPCSLEIIRAEKANKPDFTNGPERATAGAGAGRRVGDGRREVVGTRKQFLKLTAEGGREGGHARNYILAHSLGTKRRRKEGDVRIVFVSARTVSQSLSQSVGQSNRPLILAPTFQLLHF